MNQSEVNRDKGRLRGVERSPEVHRANAEQIAQLHAEGYSIGEISSKTNLPRTYITSVMDVLHLKRRGGGLALRGAERQRVKDTVRDLRLQGMSAPYISKKLNLTRSHVSFFIRELRDEGRLPKANMPYRQSAEIADALKGE